MADPNHLVRAVRSKCAELLGIDRRSLALLRIGMGLMLVADVVKRSLSFSAHYTEDGVAPRAVILDLIPPPSPFLAYYWTGSSTLVALQFLIAGVLGLFVIVGYRTRLALLLSYFLLISVQLRNPWICHTGDQYFAVLVLWCMFLPLGNVFSIDRLRNPRKPLLPLQYVSFGTVALLLQIFWFYVGAGLLKHREPVWTSGEALGVFVGIETYARPFGMFLAKFPALGPLMTYGTMALEGIGPVLMFSPIWTRYLRLVLVAAFVVFHAGIQLSIYIGIFEILSIVAVVAFLPALFWESIWPRVLAWRWVAAVERGGGAWLRRRFARDAGLQDVEPPVYRVQPVVEGVAAVLLSILIAGNISGLVHAEGKVPPIPEPHDTISRKLGVMRPTRKLVRLLSLNQRWRIFTEIDKPLLAWFLVVGELEDGSVVDVLERKPFTGLSRPVMFSAGYPNHNTRRFWWNMSRDSIETKRLRPLLADYLAREWDDREGQRLSRIAIFHVAFDPSGSQGRQVRLLTKKPLTPQGRVGIEDWRPLKE